VAAPDSPGQLAAVGQRYPVSGRVERHCLPVLAAGSRVGRPVAQAQVRPQEVRFDVVSILDGHLEVIEGAF